MQLQEFLKSDHWLRRYCILSGGVFYSEPPCIPVCEEFAAGEKSAKQLLNACAYVHE